MITFYEVMREKYRSRDLILRLESRVKIEENNERKNKGKNLIRANDFIMTHYHQQCRSNAVVILATCDVTMTLSDCEKSCEQCDVTCGRLPPEQACFVMTF